MAVKLPVKVTLNNDKWIEAFTDYSFMYIFIFLVALYVIFQFNSEGKLDLEQLIYSTSKGRCTHALKRAGILSLIIFLVEALNYVIILVVSYALFGVVVVRSMFVCLSAVLVLDLLFFVCEGIYVGKMYGMPYINAPAVSLSFFNRGLIKPLSVLSIAGLMVILLLLKAAITMLVTVGAIMISKRTSMEKGTVMVIAVLIGILIVVSLGMRVFYSAVF